jgi:hypothetical protein
MSIENPNRLAFAGPAHPANGFPMWFEDGTGLRLELVTDADPMAPAIADLQTPGAPVSFPGNYPDEAFYFMAEAQLPVGGAGVEGRARVILAIEAAFGGVGLPDPNARVVFARIRVRMDDVKPGQKYIITHPYGVIDDPLLTADDNGRFFHTFDLGIVENDCTAVLRTGQVAPFLQWDAGAPGGYIGDGVTDHKVTGSPFGTNFVRIEGPGIREGGGTPDPADPGNMDKVWTDLFSIQGRIAKQLGVGPSRVAVGNTGAGFRVSAQANRIDLIGNGRDYSGIADLVDFPVNLKLVNRTDRPPTVVNVVPTDAVYIERAQYDVAAQSLTVAARSSNSAAVLTVEATGEVVDTNPKVFGGLSACPAELVITSSFGGTGRQAVELVGVSGGNLGVAAGAPATISTRVGVETILDGSGSRLATAFQWTQTGGAAVALTDSAIAQAKFTPTATGPLQFTLTVQGPGGPDSATVDVTVDAALPPDVITIEQAEYRTSKRQFRAGGTISNVPNVVIVSFNGAELGRSQPDVTGAWSVRFDVPEGDPVPTNGDVLTINSNSGSETPNIIIRN